MNSNIGIVMIDAIENRLLSNSKGLYLIWQASYLIEAQLLRAKNFPPFALVAWLENSGDERITGYVYHHGILWKYDLSTLFPHALIYR